MRFSPFFLFLLLFLFAAPACVPGSAPEFDNQPHNQEHEEHEEHPECSNCWELDQARYSESSLDLSNYIRNARASVFRPDGERLYIVGRDTLNIVEVHLHQPWEIQSAEYLQEFSLGPQFVLYAHGLFIRPDDGAKMWVFNRTAILEFTLNTPWDVSSADFSKQLNLSDTIARGHDIDFSPDGTRLFIDDRNHQAIFEFALATPWDIDTAELAYTLDISDVEEEVRGIEFRPDGNAFFLLDTARQEVLEYEVPQAWSLEGASLKTLFDVSQVSLNPRGLTFFPSGDRFLITDATDRILYQFQIP